MTINLYRIILPVKDIHLAEKFYSGLLNQPGIRVSQGRHYFNLGGIVLACYDPVADGDDLGSWKFHKNQYFYLSVDNLEEIRNQLINLDCENPGPIQHMPWGETLFYAKDPFGNPICYVDETTVFLGNEK